MRKLDHALALAARGLRVFPLIPGGKEPMITAFQLNATNDARAITEWWTRPGWENCNIGVSTTGRVVMDIDVKKGRAGIKSYEDVGGTYDTLVVRTATGGYHCYFDGPDSKSMVNMMPGLDVRSHHGYVVGPGSTTVANGRDCVDGEYEIAYDLPIAPVPLLVEIALSPPGQRLRRDEGELDSEVAVANAVEWLKQQPPAIEGQGGDDMTYRVMARLVRDYALSDQTAYQIAQAHWNYRCVPPWDGDELWTKIQNASAYGTGDLGQALPDATFGKVDVTPPPPIPPPEDPREVYAEQLAKVRLGNAMDETEIKPRRWRVHKLALEGDVTILGGTGAAGKSAAKLAMFAHFAVGRDFGEFKLAKPNVPLRMFVYNAEDDVEEQSRRLSATCQAYDIDYNEARKNIAFVDDTMMDVCVAVAEGFKTPIQNEDMANMLVQFFGENRIDIASFDPLLNTHRCNENDNGHMLFVLKIFRAIARAAAASVILVHHTSKSGDSRDDASAFRGAANIVNSARNAIMMSRISEADVKHYNLRPTERELYSRIDSRKTNMYKSNSALAWIKWASVKMSNGEIVGVPIVVDLKPPDEQTRKLAEWFVTYMRDKGVASMLRSDAIKVIQANDTSGFYGHQSNSSLYNLINNVFSKPVTAGQDQVRLAVATDGQKVLTLV